MRADLQLEPARRDRQEPDRQQRDVVSPLPAPDDLVQNVLEESVGFRRRLAERSHDRIEAIVDGLPAPLDQPVRVEEKHGAVHELDRLLAVLRCEPGAGGSATAALEQLDSPVRIGDDRRRMAG